VGVVEVLALIGEDLLSLPLDEPIFRTRKVAAIRKRTSEPEAS
jgi:hypothetical protein